MKEFGALILELLLIQEEVTYPPKQYPVLDLITAFI